MKWMRSAGGGHSCVWRYGCRQFVLHPIAQVSAIKPYSLLTCWIFPTHLPPRTPFIHGGVRFLIWNNPMHAIVLQNVIFSTCIATCVHTHVHTFVLHLSMSSYVCLIDSVGLIFEYMLYYIIRGVHCCLGNIKNFCEWWTCTGSLQWGVQTHACTDAMSYMSVQSLDTNILQVPHPNGMQSTNLIGAQGVIASHTL